MMRIFASCRRCLPFLFCAKDTPSKRDAWVISVKNALQDDSQVCISENLCQALLLDAQDDFLSFVDDAAADHLKDGDPSFLLIGLPKRPLYIELGHRLYTMSMYRNGDIPLLLPAQHFGLTENPFAPTLLLSTLPHVPTTRSLQTWINIVGARGLFHILGMRSTVGTDPRNLLPPSWDDLLRAAELPHKNSKLTVAARARSKHFHRGKEQFFGTVSGPPESQNVETQDIVKKLLENAAWINIHTCVGNDGDPFLEVRVESGYGARWKVDWSTDTVHPCNVSFRGFLEPQMENGHEQKWRH